MKMRFYILIITVAMALSVRLASAQSNHFSEGSTIINAGVGMGAFLFYFPFQNYTPTPTLSIEHATTRLGSGEIGAGVVTGFRKLDLRYRTTPAVWSQYVAGASMSYYPDALQSDNYNLYASVHGGIAYNTYSDPKGILEKNTYKNHVGIYAAAVLGGRYYITNNIALFGEAGVDLDWVKIGVSFRLPN